MFCMDLGTKNKLNLALLINLLKLTGNYTYHMV